MDFKTIPDFNVILAQRGLTPEAFDKSTEGDTVDEKAHKKIKLMAAVANGDRTEKAIWYPWFWINEDAPSPSGSGLSFDVAGCDDSYAHVASRHKFIDRADAIHAGQTFLTEYEEYYLG